MSIPDPRARFHSGRAYIAFDEAMRRVEPWLHARAAACSGADLEWGRRLAQRVVEIALNDFVLICARRLGRGAEPLPDPGEVYAGGVVIDNVRGCIRVRPALLVRSLVLFAGHWCHALLVHVAALFGRRSHARGAATLVHGVGLAELTREDSDAQFLAFCRKGPIAPLRKAQRFIVQSVMPLSSSEPDVCAYHRVPLFGLVRTNRVSIGAFMRFVREHLGAVVRFGSAVARFPPLALLARDFAYETTARRLDRERLIENVIITNSNYSAQPLWMRPSAGRARATHMVWYSQNVLPFTYLFDALQSRLPHHRHFAFDEVWVWTEGFADYIRQLDTGAAIHVVGPVLWYLPEPAAGRYAAHEIRIVVFDVTPVRPEIARRIGLLYNYYSANTVLQFIEDIAAAAREIETKLGKKARVVLKPKRSHDPARDPRYIAAIDRLTAGQDAVLTLEPPQSNVWALCEGCDVVIAIPWSSPVYVATQVGTPALYYDPTSELAPTYDTGRGVRFAAGPAALGEELRRLLAGARAVHAPRSETDYPRTT